MKHIKLAMVLCAMTVLFPAVLYAQETMTTELANVSPVTNIAPIENYNYEGEADTIASVQLSSSINGDPVGVAFRTIGDKDLSSGVGFVDMPSILNINYMTDPLDGMEAFVGGFNGNLWGQGSYLLLVDGVPRDVGSVMPTEIAQVTFLKGVSAVALYGSQAAKGVLLITTKRGSVQGQRITVRTNAGVYVPKSYPKYLGSAEYMTLYNEARVNDGLGALYSADDIYNSGSGNNEFRYPNVDYYSSKYLQQAYSRYDGTVEIEGGNEKARYYTNMGFYRTGSQMAFGEAANNHDKRFNIRGNVDMNLNNFISAKVDASAIFYTGVGVNTNYWGGASTLRPNRFSPLIPLNMIEESDLASQTLTNNTENIIDGKYVLGGTQLDQTNPIGDIYAGGTNSYNSRQFQFNTGVDADLAGLIKGLSFSSLFGVDYASTYNVSFDNDYVVFEPTWNSYSGSDLIGNFTQYGQDARSGEQNINNSWYRQTFSFSGQFNYQKDVDNQHHISAILLANGFQRSISAIYHKESNANLGLHLGYDFRNKYYVEFDGALVHSAKLPERNRQAFSPTATIGWRLSEEGFLADVAAIDNLKLNISAGILNSDLDIINSDPELSSYFLYQNIYNQTDGAWTTWKDGLNNRTTDSRRGANPDMDYPQRKEVSIGLDASLFNKSVVFNGSVFTNETSGIIIQNNVLFPSYFTTGFPNSSFVPYANYNNDQRFGVDFNLRVNQSIGEVDLSLGVSGIYYTTKAAKRAEFNEDSYQNRQGQPLDAIWGLENLGFFADDADIQNSPEQAFGEVSSGDIKYKDQNNDGVINNQDEVYLGKAGWFGSPFTMGVNLTAKWKNFTFFALGVARTGAHAMKNNNYFWVNGEDKYSEVVRDRWTEETKNTASYPRLTTQNGNNNFRNSDFWLYSTNRFDLSRVQVTYDFPETIIGNNSFIRELGIYINGVNLLTIAPNREILELNINTAPQTRFYNLGIKAMF